MTGKGWAGRLAAGLLALGVALVLRDAVTTLPPGLWWQAVVAPDGADMRQVLLHHAILPRAAVALLCGAALGLSGAIFQQVLRNPLAEPGTLGVFAGARLALALSMLWLPAGAQLGREAVALAGGGAAVGLVLALSWRGGFRPLGVILAGLVVGLLLSAVNGVMGLFNYQLLSDLFLWGAGSLDQNDWRVVARLAPWLLVAALLAALLRRPLVLLGLEEGGARALGMRTGIFRVTALALATALSALVASAVGIIAFLGLAAPALARLAGARRPGESLFWAPLLGAALLLLTDGLAHLASGITREIPAGAVTAVLGAPLLLAMLPRLHDAGEVVRPAGPARRIAHPGRVLAISLGLLALLLLLATGLGRDAAGWYWASAGEWDAVLVWRAPRAVAALAAGAMLGVAGVLVQRATGNPMAGPEVLGISSGAALGVILLAMVGGGGRAAELVAAAAGAGLVLAAILALDRRSGPSSTRLLLAGISLATALNAVTALFLAGGDPRGARLLGWMAGSTYRVGLTEAAWAVAVAAAGLALAPLLSRPLAILPLGAATSAARGVNLPRTRLLILALAGTLTAAATLVVGPLSFAGLLGPHAARLVGWHRPTAQLLGAAMIGGGIMLAADLLGRCLLFPWQVPAGLLASLLGGAYLVVLLGRAGRTP